MTNRWLIASLFLISCFAYARSQTTLRPPAVPLLTSDPYLSVWSEADKATDDVTRHWTKHPNPLVALIRIDGTTYRILGNSPTEMPALPQTGLKITPTRTTYTFANDEAKVVMSFFTPALPTDLEIYSRPLTYLSWTVTSLDSEKHKVQIYESASSLLAVNDPSQAVDCKSEDMGKFRTLRAGTVAQTYLKPAGDDTRIDWG